MKAKLIVEGKEFDVEILGLQLTEEAHNNKKQCKDCDYAVKDFFKCAPGGVCLYWCKRTVCY